MKNKLLTVFMSVTLFYHSCWVFNLMGKTLELCIFEHHQLLNSKRKE